MSDNSWSSSSAEEKEEEADEAPLTNPKTKKTRPRSKEKLKTWSTKNDDSVQPLHGKQKKEEISSDSGTPVSSPAASKFGEDLHFLSRYDELWNKVCSVGSGF
jgi:hypothetical protein